VSETTTPKFNAMKGKSVLITGHNGFKGAWLTEWLKILGAKVTGISLDPSTDPSHFMVANISNEIIDLRIDIRDSNLIERVIVDTQPDFVFHMAAQALVGNSYEDPMKTWSTNVLGTLNVLESLRKLQKNCAAIIVTSDKCYDNVEWIWGYRESDRLGGSDPYSASKAGAELVFNSHLKSFFPSATSKVRIASVRAGNVIGGGDWSPNRIVPDFVFSWSSQKTFSLRNPNSTRPWQHVLEPLSGYINLALDLLENPELHGESFNFGPRDIESYNTQDLINELSLHMGQVVLETKEQIENMQAESKILRLNCDKSLYLSKWHATMLFHETVKMTADWYKAFYENPAKIANTTYEQIIYYAQIARERGLQWAQ
jgi:CDP-glucose 4,6-dehydratase